MEQNNEELQHHGILGMRWGVRRYQNKDGSLTPAGRKRVAKMKDEYTALTGKRLIRKPTPKSKTSSNQNTEDANKKKRIKDMSDTEITDKINRLEKEKRLASLQSETAGKGEKFVSTVGKQVLAPAAIAAGKNVLTELLTKIGKNVTGLDPKTQKDALSELRKEVDELELKKRKTVAEDYFEKRNKKNEASNNSKSKDSNETKNKTEDSSERAKTEFVYESSNKKNTSNKSKETVIIDAEYEEVGKSTVDKYKRLRLPAPKR